MYTIVHYEGVTLSPINNISGHNMVQTQYICSLHSVNQRKIHFRNSVLVLGNSLRFR